LDFERAKELWHDANRAEFVARFSDEPRHGLIAELDDKLWTAIYTVRGDRARIISVRRAREKEEAIYNDSTRI
jgi:uncharacterized DUF497 family protein